MTRPDPVTRLWRAAGSKVPAFIVAYVAISTVAVVGMAAAVEILLRIIAGV